jgi:hypothetical protein
MLNKHNFDIAQLAPSGDDAKAIFRGVYVTPKASYVTDGRLAVRVSAPESQPSLFNTMDGIEPAEWFTPFIVDRETALLIAKNAPKKTSDDDAQLIAVDVSTEVNGQATVAVNDLLRQAVIRSNKVEGEYPDIDKLTPAKKNATLTICFNAELLAALTATVNKFCKSHGTGSVILRFTNANAGMRIDADGIGQTLTALLMPQMID